VVAAGDILVGAASARSLRFRSSSTLGFPRIVQVPQFSDTWSLFPLARAATPGPVVQPLWRIYARIPLEVHDYGSPGFRGDPAAARRWHTDCFWYHTRRNSMYYGIGGTILIVVVVLLVLGRI
jgi:hypothetical protein